MARETIRRGSVGDDVEAWQHWLLGAGYYRGVVDGQFGPATEAATQAAQRALGLTADGVVGPFTWTAAGVPVPHDTDPAPAVLAPKRLTYQERLAKYGGPGFSFVPSPVASNPEAVKIAEGWVRANITFISLPLDGVQGYAPGARTPFHKAVAADVLELFDAWKRANLLRHIRSWDGSWSPRYIRGSRSILSNHALGTAFDINAKWNGLGAKPAPEGQPGSVLPLVPIAEGLGWTWGGRWAQRCDPMHIQRD